MITAVLALAMGLPLPPTASTDQVSNQAADVRCYQALAWAFAANPAQRDSTTSVLSFYIGRLSVRGDAWRNEIFAPSTPALDKSNFSPVAEKCRQRAMESILPSVPAVPH